MNRSIVLGLFLMSFIAQHGWSAEFVPLPYETDGGVFGATAMSNDGSLLVGSLRRRPSGINVFQPAVWTREGGIEIPEWGIGSGSLSGVSGDGGTIAGNANGRAFTVVDASVTWLDTPAGYTHATAVAISRDGSTIIGHGDRSNPSYEKSPGFWNSDGEFTSLEGNGFDPNSVYGVSGDGSVIVGTLGFRWTVEENAQLLPLPSPEYVLARAYDISAEGRWTVGIATPGSGTQAVRWDGLSDTVELVPVEDWGSWASAVSDNGQTVVGQLRPSSQSSSYMAALWTEETGFVPLQDLLADEYGLAEELTGWHLYGAWEISGDGRFILGSGYNPQGDLQSFLVDLAPQVLPGDYNNNGLVEQEDLDLVLAHWGQDGEANVPPTWTNDVPTGSIDQEELDRVLGNWGNTRTTATTSAAVPEPGSAALLAMGLAVMLAWGRRYRRQVHNAA